jgi:hypothetical protein
MHIIGVMALATGLLSASPAIARAAPETPPTNERVMASLLFHLTKYVVWPSDAFSSPDQPITIGILNSEGISADLERMVTRRRIDGRPLQVKRLAPGADPTGCQILFLESINPHDLSRSLDQSSGRAILTVGVSDQFLALGGIVKLTKSGSRLRLQINAGAARRERLRLSSKLLELADEVKRS